MKNKKALFLIIIGIILIISALYLQLHNNYEDIIINAYKKYPKADIIAFIVEHEDKSKEKKVLKEGKVNIFNSLKLSSVQIV